MISTEQGRTDALELVGIPSATARMLRYYLIRPDARPHARELQRVLHLGGASLQRELERLVALGALDRQADGRRVRYGAVHHSPFWKAVGILAAVSADPSTLVQNAVADVAGVQAAFIFGSSVRGTLRDDSDIDLFVVEGPDADRKKLLRQLAEVELLLDREIHTVRYTSQALADRLGDRNHPAWRFVRDALAGPKKWVVGAASVIAPLAAAAGIRLPELTGLPA